MPISAFSVRGQNFEKNSDRMHYSGDDRDFTDLYDSQGGGRRYFF